MIQLHRGDCLEVMPKLQPACIDLVLCDLPYGTTACNWDDIIPFDKLWAEYDRVLKPNGVVLLFGSQPFTTLMIASNIEQHREELIWLKNKQASGFGKNQRHMKIHENIEVFSKSGIYTFNPQKWLVSDKEFITQRKTFSESYVGNNIYSGMYRKRKEDTGERFPLSIVSCRIPFTPQKNKEYSEVVDLRVHPTQKPIELLEYLIKTYSNENDIVLDNCMGSGSTGVACKRTNRNFVGIELNENYYNIAKERIENEGNDIMKLPKAGVLL